MKTAPTEKRKWATRKPAAHNEDQHGLLAVMAVGCWLRVGPLAVERMGSYGKATALARKRPGAGGWIAYAASGRVGGRGMTVNRRSPGVDPRLGLPARPMAARLSMLSRKDPWILPTSSVR